MCEEPVISSLTECVKNRRRGVPEGNVTRLDRLSDCREKRPRTIEKIKNLLRTVEKSTAVLWQGHLNVQRNVIGLSWLAVPVKANHETSTNQQTNEKWHTGTTKSMQF
jgi:hypothetical protein